MNFFNNIRYNNGVLCYDFEDSINSGNSKNNRKLKSENRNNIKTLIESYSEKIDYNYLGFRINSPNSEFYNDDLNYINSLDGIRCIFLPKVESHEMIENLINDTNYKVTEIIPIIESFQAFQDLEYILSYRNERVNKFAFGHCDFNLDCGNYPFYHHENLQYWKWIAYLNDNAIKYRKQIINSPYLKLSNEFFFSQVISNLKKYESVTGQITLCLKQTEACNNNRYNVGKIQLSNKFESDVFQKAETYIEKFEKYLITDKSFALTSDKVLLSPQEYKSAKEFNKIFKNHLG
ncbi:aldolase/citrate lyase family protein [Bacteroidota bacterium]